MNFVTYKNFCINFVTVYIMLCIKLKFFSSSLIFFVWTSRCVLAGPGNCDSVSLSVILTYYNTLSVCYVSTPLFYPILQYYMI
jgi:hypothetical protein